MGVARLRLRAARLAPWSSNAPLEITLTGPDTWLLDFGRARPDNRCMSSSVVVRVTHRFPAGVSRVFDAWVTPAQASRFLFATRTGNVMQCEINAVPGGGFVVTDRRPQAEGDESVFDVVHRGAYIEVDRPRRLVFDFAVTSYTDHFTRVSLDFLPHGNGGCELVLTHDLGDSEDVHAMETASRRGWTTMLAVLERELFPKRVGFVY